MKRNNCKMWLLVLSAVLCVNTESAATDCTLAPDCETLGYTKTATSCNGGDVILKCPTDTFKVACNQISSYEPKDGDILYSDRSVSSTVATEKKAIGVVFDASNRLAVALENAKIDNSSNGEQVYFSPCDAPLLDNCTDSSKLTSCAIDGKANTYAILVSCAGGSPGSTPNYAVNVAHRYQPSGCSAAFCKAGKWFLPSAKELTTLYNNRSKINSVISSVGGQTIQFSTSSNNFWSSNEKDSNYAWRQNLDGSFSPASKTGNWNKVRPVLAF